MKKIAKRWDECTEHCLMLHSLRFLARSSKSEMLSLPNSPLLVLLQFVDANVVLFGDAPLTQVGQTKATPLHHVSTLVDPFDYSTPVPQLTLAKQLIEHGANVNTLSIPHGETPLYTACFAGNVTNLDLFELLLGKGADQNAQDNVRRTLLLCTSPFAPGGAGPTFC
jgi:ankyrin repeat protein